MQTTLNLDPQTFQLVQDVATQTGFSIDRVISEAIAAQYGCKPAAIHRAVVGEIKIPVTTYSAINLDEIDLEDLPLWTHGP